MGLKIHIAFLLIAVAMAASAPAAEQGNLADSIRSSNEDIGILLSPLVTVRKAAESFAEQRKITFGEADGQGMVYEFGSKTVPATPTSPEFMDARQRTYEEICKELIEKSKHPAEWFRTAWTMEYLDVESGNYEIGVILKADPYLPRALSEQERSAANQTKGLPIYAVLSGKSPWLVQKFGTRFYYDETGNPALLAFGQCAIPTADRTSPREYAAARNKALEEAQRKATEELRGFLLVHGLESQTQSLVARSSPLTSGFRKHPSGLEIAVSVVGCSLGKQNVSVPSPAAIPQKRPIQSLSFEYDF
ncbi:MAG: hypothetical protein IKR48_06410 [Kiritimatiellae bacterium]|nr:hypothetical protein [Kiritimatiellia bacterium]